MLTNIFDYHLPPELIAQKPAEERDKARLMVLCRAGRKIEHYLFQDLPSFLCPGDLLVLNDTRVIPARLYGKKSTGASIEFTLIEEVDSDKNLWRCLAKPGKRLKVDQKITVGEDLSLIPRAKAENGSWTVEISTTGDLMEALEKWGRAPLPPYIKRKHSDPAAPDRERYQTVYARYPGAVAAPTAGLHFTGQVLEKLRENGVNISNVTLHVGWGSFAPVREERAENHRLGKEYFTVPEDTAEAVTRTKSSGGRVIAVGTTTVRALESARETGRVKPKQGHTDLFILPGYEFKTIDAMITNFHLPRSSLLMLVAAFAGREFILNAYRQAVEKGYRFYSYGDAMLIW